MNVCVDWSGFFFSETGRPTSGVQTAGIGSTCRTIRSENPPRTRATPGCQPCTDDDYIHSRTHARTHSSPVTSAINKKPAQLRQQRDMTARRDTHCVGCQAACE